MKQPKADTQAQIKTYVSTLPDDCKLIITYLRSFILPLADEIAEHIKWNSLSFYYTGEMKTFVANPYQRDILVCNLHRGKILLVFPSGAKLTADLKGKNYPDGRKIITFTNLDEIVVNKDRIAALIKQWLALVDK